MKKYYIIFSFIVAAEIVAIALIRTRLLQKRAQLGSAVAVIPISKENISTSTASALKYFYEPQPNRTEYFSAPWLSYTVKYTVNSDSLYERFDYTPKKPANTFRIITLGDSFTMGATVNTSDNYPETLEDMLNEKCSAKVKFEVINLGVGGYDIAYSVERFRLRGIKYEPDLVLWLLGTNDFEEISEIMAPKIRAYVAEGLFTGREIGIAKDNYRPPAYKKAVDEMRREMGPEGILRYQQSALRRISEYYGGNLVILSLNTDYQYLLEDFANARPNTYLRKNMWRYWEKGYVQADGHPDKRGYRVIAEDAFEFLKEKNLIPCD